MKYLVKFEHNFIINHISVFEILYFLERFMHIFNIKMNPIFSIKIKSKICLIYLAIISVSFLVCQVGRPRRSSGIPRSRGSSREASPSSHRYGTSSRYAQSQLRASAERTLPKRPLLTENILKQSREAESALADALVSYNIYYTALHSGRNR